MPREQGLRSVPWAAGTHSPFRGGYKLLFGIIFRVLAFLAICPDYAQHFANNGGRSSGGDQPHEHSGFHYGAILGHFHRRLGSLANRLGRVRVLLWGFVLSAAGSLLVALASRGVFAIPLLMVGRILQGLSAACVMPASLALVKVYWDGAARQRAVSLWSMGSWGGSGFAALFGGIMAENVGWRYIFMGSALLSLIGLLMVRGTPESKAATDPDYTFDTKGMLTFTVAMVALQIVTTPGSEIGWTNPITLVLSVVVLVGALLFFRTESRARHPFVDFKLFRNATFTGTVSNLLLNAVAGMLIVSMMLLQLGGRLSAQQAGMLTLGYAIAIIAFIRVGENF